MCCWVRRFVLSEATGVTEDVGYYRSGMVMVPATRLAESISYYLPRPALRETIARRGRELFMARPQSEELREAVEELAARAGCASS